MSTFTPATLELCWKTPTKIDIYMKTFSWAGCLFHSYICFLFSTWCYICDFGDGDQFVPLMQCFKVDWLNVFILLLQSWEVAYSHLSYHTGLERCPPKLFYLDHQTSSASTRHSNRWKNTILSQKSYLHDKEGKNGVDFPKTHDVACEQPLSKTKR